MEYYNEVGQSVDVRERPQEGWWGTDVYLHNTLNVVRHIHLVILTGITRLFALGLIYSIIPDITKCS